MTISYIFLFSPNFSGTTIISQYLNNNIRNSYLPKFGNNEGQMAPSVRNIMRKNPWDENVNFDWNFIKNEWDNLAEIEKKSIFIESSPPNIMRVDSILNQFKNCKYIFSISSPYLYIGSALSKVKKSNSNKIENITNNWINKANMQIKNINKFGDSGIQTTYEKFCDSQNGLLESLNLDPNLILGNNIEIEGKENTKITKIINMLPKHLTFLGMSGILQINNILKQHIDILNFFGYKILTIDDCNELISRQPLLAFDGIHRRLIKEINLNAFNDIRN